MAWNGSGTYSIAPYIWVNDLNAGIPITASRMDSEFSDVATGINSCLAKNGENAATANLNIGGFRLTSVGNASARTDAITAGQIQDGGVDYVLASGTNTITAALAPAITAYANGQFFLIKFANTTTGNSTLNINSVGALNTYYADGTTRLPGGECIQNNIGIFVYDSSLNSSAGGLVLINPSRITGSATGTPTGFSGSPGTCTLTYSVGTDGHTVTVTVGTGISGTSNATTFTITGLPSYLAPTVTQQGFIVSIRDNGTNGAGNLQMNSGSSTITLGNGFIYSAGGFTASANKVFPNGGAATFTYQI